MKRTQGNVREVPAQGQFKLIKVVSNQSRRTQASKENLDPGPCEETLAAVAADSSSLLRRLEWASTCRAVA